MVAGQATIPIARPRIKVQQPVPVGCRGRPAYAARAVWTSITAAGELEGEKAKRLAQIEKLFATTA